MVSGKVLRSSIDPALVMEPTSDSSQPKLVAPWKRVIYIALGFLFVGLAYLGILLPGLPATPFLLAASFFFVRSSPRLHRWLRSSPIFGPLLTDWEEHGGIRRSIKVTASVLVLTAVSLTITLSNLPIWAKCMIGGFAGIGLIVIWSLKTVDQKKE